MQGFSPTHYTTKVEIKYVLGKTTVIHLNQNIMEAQIYGGLDKIHCGRR